MGARLLILIAVCLGLGVYFVTRAPKKSASSGVELVDDQDLKSPLTPKERESLDVRNKTLESRDLPGEEPNPRPQLSDFSVRTEVNTATGKNQLCFYVTEAHGYYVETLRLKFWYTGPDGKLTEEQSPLGRYAYINDYIKAKDTLKTCIEVVPAEFNQVGGSLGTSQNWAAKVEFFNRSRAANPNPLPEL